MISHTLPVRNLTIKNYSKHSETTGGLVGVWAFRKYRFKPFSHMDPVRKMTERSPLPVLHIKHDKAKKNRKKWKSKYWLLEDVGSLNGVFWEPQPSFKPIQWWEGLLNWTEICLTYHIYHWNSNMANFRPGSMCQKGLDLYFLKAHTLRSPPVASECLA